jgi:osmoprotectant transport system permease protein
VELPLAAPTILAGVRTASVWVVGAATIAQPVGATSLGNYVFAGLQTRNALALGMGCALSAALAMVLDGLLQLIETAAARREPRLAMWAAGGLVSLALSPLALGLITRDAPDFNGEAIADDAAPTDRKPYVVAAKAFTEQYILANAMQQALQAAGYQTIKKEGMGSTLLLDALAGGEIDCYVDYTGTIWATAMKQEETISPAETLVDVTAFLRRDLGIICLGQLGFNNTYAIAIHAPRADELGVTSLAQLAPHVAPMSIGSDVEFFDRAEFFSLRKRYDLRFAEQRALDATFMYEAAARGDVDLIAGYSTDGRLDRYDLRVLDDPRQVFPPYDAVLLVSERLARNDRAATALAKMVGQIDDARMRRANRMVDVDNKSPAAAAEWLMSGEAISR